MIQALDHRAARLEAWVRARLAAPVSWSVVSADASSRRYFRAQARARSWIAVDSPPESQNNQAFVDIAALFRGAGLNVPTVLACDLEAGFLLLSDLGRQRFIDVLNADNADDLFASAIAALVWAILMGLASTSHATRIKDIAHFEGIRDNQLIGYGLVVGLDGTGLERITFNDTFDGFPMFSPDGSQLVFASNRGSAAEGDTNVFLADWVE